MRTDQLVSAVRSFTINYWLIASLLLCPFVLLSQAQPIPCDDSYYLFLVPHSTATTSAMYRVTVDATNGLPSFELVNDDIGHWVTAAGYSVQDRMIYALDYNTRELLRIDAAGSVTTLGVPPGLDADNVFAAGETSASGGRLFVIGRDPMTGHDKTMFFIRLHSTDFSAGRVSVLSEFDSAIEDMAFDPVRGILYGYDDTNNKLVWVDAFSGKVSDYFSRAMPGVERLGSLFFDTKGQLHAYGASGGTEEGVFFNINKLQGEAEKLANGPKGRFSDGCACPYRVRHHKTITPQQALPCGEVTIEYTLINHAGTAVSYQNLTDTLPSGLIITEIVEKPVGATITSGIGSNVLHVERFDLLLDTNRVIIKARVAENATSGVFNAHRAQLGELREGLGTVIYSDNPYTPQPGDPTAFEILSGDDFQLEKQQDIVCGTEGVLLSTGIADAVYRWSTGDTTATIFVETVGGYAVTVTTSCGVYEDSIQISKILPPLTLSLDDSPQIETGETLELIPRLTTQRPLIYHWQSNETVDCAACPTLTVRPFKTTTYQLTVSDEYGCTASDSVRVQVQTVRRLYFPTAFSPNGDGVNDVFYIQGLEGSAEVVQLQVFNRWGGLLFEIAEEKMAVNDKWHGWNGYAKGQLLEAGTYIWVAILEFPDGNKDTFSGEIRLIK